MEKGIVKLRYYPTQYQLTNIFRKSVAKSQFVLLRDFIVGPLISKGEYKGFGDDKTNYHIFNFVKFMVTICTFTLCMITGI